MAGSVHRMSKTRNGFDYSKLEPRLPLAAFVVNSLVDDASGAVDGMISLREAVIAANSNESFGDAAAGEDTGDTITFALPEGSTYQLTEGEIEILDGLTILGGSRDLTISGQGESRLFSVDTTEQVRFARLSFTDGRALNGGAIFASADSDLFLFETIFEANHSEEDGAAIFSSGGKLLSNGSEFLANEGVGATVVVDQSETILLQSEFIENVSDEGVLKIIDGDFFARDTYIERMGRDAIDFLSGVGINGAANVSLVSLETFTIGDVLKIDGPADVFIADSDLLTLGAVVNNDGGKLISRNSSFSANTDTDADTAFRVNGGSISISDADIFGRTSVTDGRVSFFNSDINPGFSGGIASLNSFVLLDNTSIFSDGGVLGGGSESEVIIRNNSLVSGGQFGTIGIRDGSRLFVEQSTINGNQVGGDGGGAIRSENATVIINDSTIIGNASGFGGGFYVDGGAVYVNNSQVMGSGADASAAFVTGNAVFSVSNGSIEGRSADAMQLGEGALLRAENGSRIFVTGTELVNLGENSEYLNISDSNAVLNGVDLQSGEQSGILSTDSNLFFRNSTVDSEILSTESFISAQRGFTEIDNSVFSNLSISSDEQQFGGGAVQVLGGALRVTDSTFVDNTSSTNGVAGSIWIGADTRATIRNSLFEGNRAEFGGAIVSHGFVALESSRFINNEATFSGGAMYSVATARTRVIDSLFSENKAGALGGALFDRGVLDISDSDFEFNEAADKGAFFAENSILNNNSFLDNIPNDF